MILIDTSVWIDHFRRENMRLVQLLEAKQVLCHHFIVGELASGHLRNRGEIIALLEKLPSASAATHQEAMAFLEARRLSGRGIGYVDLHLLASAALDRVPLWALDKTLMRVAASLGLDA